MEIVKTASDSFNELPLSLVIPGNNPRKYFDPVAQKELEDSIRAKGVIQAITVKQRGNLYEIIAGERRYRAALVVFGDTGSIPALVKNVDDETAETMSLIENTHREQMSVTEEARAVERALARAKGDRDEAARALAWPLAKVNRRLALLNLDEEVMKSLDERKISIGHAELLASVTKDKQIEALAKIIEHGLSVQFVKDNLVKKATLLAKGVFPKEHCASCSYNSEKQASLFSENIGDGYCTNQNCFDGKTREYLEGLKQKLTDDVPTVRITELGDNSYVSLVTPLGLSVTEEQYNTCKGCGSYGIVISGQPDDLGSVHKDICFDTVCHVKKSAEKLSADRPITENQPKAAKTNKTSQKSQPPGGGVTKVSKPEVKTQPKSGPAEPSAKVKEYRCKLWRTMAKKEIASQPEIARSLVLSLALTGNLCAVNDATLRQIFTKISGNNIGAGFTDDLVTQVSELTQEQKDKLFTALAVAAVDRISEEKVVTSLRLLKADIANYFQVNEDFLNLLTKSEIESVAIEIGIDKVFEERFSKVVKKKNKEIIEEILGLGDRFPFQGAVPSMMKF